MLLSVEKEGVRNVTQTARNVTIIIINMMMMGVGVVVILSTNISGRCSYKSGRQ